MTNNLTKYKKLLKEFVSFKSISTDSEFKSEVGKTVSWLNNLLTKNGFKTKTLQGKNSNPVVFGKYIVSKTVKTVLIYGHYDVQPAKKEDGWKTDPFVLDESKSRLFARGVVDNKGQILIHVFNAINLIKEKKLKYNLIFLIEGNEETSNPDLGNLVKKHKKDLACDIVMISDGELTNAKPTIEVSLRGGFNVTLTYKTGKNNLHSGIFGGAVPSAPLELIRFLNKLINSDGSVSYKEFYMDVDKISKKDLKNNQRLHKKATELLKISGVNKLTLSNSEDFFTKTGLTPTVQITGFKSGYIDSGYANIVPSIAEVRLNFRIVASQKPEIIFKSFQKFVRENTPKYVNYTLDVEGLHSPIKIDINNKFVVDTKIILEKVYKEKVNYKNVGGAIPVVSDFKEILGVDTLLIPFCNEDCNMHGTDENFEIKLIIKALEFSNLFLRNDIVN